MGWASAGEIFDPVARALIDLGADEQTKRRVLGTLIDKLRDDDWDTCDESLEEFRGDLVIRALFYERGVANSAGDWPEGVLGYDKRSSEWTLTCEGGRDACGLIGRRPGTAKGHDQLVRLWATHEADLHGGDRQVPESMLIDRGSAS